MSKTVRAVAAGLVVSAAREVVESPPVITDVSPAKVISFETQRNAAVVKNTKRKPTQTAQTNIRYYCRSSLFFPSICLSRTANNMGKNSRQKAVVAVIAQSIAWLSYKIVS